MVTDSSVCNLLTISVRQLVVSGVKRFFEVCNSLSMVGDPLLKHWLEVFDATPKTLCLTIKKVDCEGFSWSLLVHQMVGDRSWIGRGSPISMPLQV